MTSRLPNTRATSFIERFNEADLALLLAVSSDEGIARAVEAFDVSSQNLFDAEPRDDMDREHLARFIGERFLLSENTSPAIRQRALDRLVSFAVRE